MNKILTNCKKCHQGKWKYRSCKNCTSQFPIPYEPTIIICPCFECENRRIEYKRMEFNYSILDTLVSCQYCGVIVQRYNRGNKPTCSDCKRQRKIIYLRDYYKKHRVKL